MRIERVGLEHHGEPALRRRHLVNRLAVEPKLAGGDRLEPGDHAQQRRLPAARRPDEDDELAVVDVKVEALNDLQIAEMFYDAVEVEARHQTASFAFGISQPP